jgi:hypothetical protein
MVDRAGKAKRGTGDSRVKAGLQRIAPAGRAAHEEHVPLLFRIG